MLGKNMFYGFIGFALAFSLTPVFALTLKESDIIADEQMYALKYTGMYQPVYDQPVKVYTYETLCKGYYTVEDNGIEIQYTGFGDLADEYTYSVPSTKVDTLQVASTTPPDEKPVEPIGIELPVDTPVELSN